MKALHPVIRILLIVVAAVMALIAFAAIFLISGDDSSDASADLTATTVAASTDSGNGEVTTTSAADEGANVAGIAERFRQAVNGGDIGSVSEFAPTASADLLEFLIGGGPYDTVECYVFDGKDECRVVNGIADFTFAVDTSSDCVSEVTYVGGE
jgi:hypothetical protein